MGLAADLGYRYEPPNLLQRWVQAFSATRGGAWFFSKTLRHMDRAVHRLSSGRTTVPELLAGVPVLMVTTIGRRSGQHRMSPLVGTPVGDTLGLIGSNFGQKSAPAWVHNLEADPHATVLYRDARRSVRARPPTDDEASEIWAGAASAYAKYQARVTGRTIRLFVLEDDENDLP
jgi:deazaflavin-dependent oxidoreductase (nitroreductase family)